MNGYDKYETYHRSRTEEEKQRDYAIAKEKGIEIGKEYKGKLIHDIIFQDGLLFVYANIPAPEFGREGLRTMRCLVTGEDGEVVK